MVYDKGSRRQAPFTEWDVATKDQTKIFCIDPTEISLK